MTNPGPIAQSRDRRARQPGDPYLSLLTLCVSGALLLLVVGALLGRWLTEVPK